MEIVTQNSQSAMERLLTVVEARPELWASVNINISRLTDKTGNSQYTPEEIQSLSLKVAKKLLDQQLRPFEGKIFVFDDGDVLALILKNEDYFGAMLTALSKEFSDNGLSSILSVNEMSERLAHIIQFAEEKKNQCALPPETGSLEKAVASLLSSQSPNAFLTRVIAERRRKNQSSKAHVLIIEDDIVTSGMVAIGLKQKCRVLQCKNATSGLISYIQHAPDVVFLDIHLPDHDGRDVLKCLHLLDPAAYIVMLTGDSKKETVELALSNGAAGFICKPFAREKIVEYVDRQIAKKA